MSTQTLDEGFARLNCRVSGRIKRLAESAATMLGQSMTAFTESALADKAQAVLDQHERITLSERDFNRFIASLDNPPAPTPELQDAIRQYLAQKADRPDANL